MKLRYLAEVEPKTTTNVQTGVRREEGPSGPSPTGFSTVPSASLALLRYWAAVRRHAWHIVIFVVATVAFTALILLQIPKEYQGTVTIRVDPSVPAEVVGNQAGNSGEVTVGPQLATDMKEIVSPAVIAPAILRLGLWKSADNSSSAPGPSALIAKVSNRTKVSLVEGTYLINISYRSASPDEAAAVANALAEQFIEHEYQTRNSALLNLSQYMRQQVQELGDRMKDSQLALNAFERENNIVNPDSMTSPLTQQLSSLQQELNLEQSKQRSLEANLALAREGSLDALLVSDRGDALVPLLQAQQQAEIEFASLASKYGPGNYLYEQQQRKLTQISKAVQKEQQHVTAQIEAQARAAAVQAGLTAKELADVKAQLDDFNRESVQYAILKQTADTDKAIYNDLLERLDSADVTAGYHSTAFRIVNLARANSAPVYPHVMLTLLFAFLLSGFLGIIGSIVASEMDRTICDPGLVRDALGIELLGFLPEVKNGADLKSLVTSTDALPGVSRNPFAEALLGIRSTLLLKESVSPLHALAVISCQPQEGKTTVVVNLAAAFAALGKRTVVVDSDLLQPNLHRTLSVPNRIGLTSLLLDKACLDDVLLPGPIDLLTVLPAGPPSVRARELLASGIDALVEELKSQFDIVILDTPPVLGFADTLNVAASVDELVLVVRAGKTPRDYVEVVMEQLRQVRATVAGMVLNGVKSQTSPSYHWYSDGHYRRYSTVNGNHDSSL